MELKADSYIEIEKRIDKVRDQYALVEGYFDTSEQTSPWIPFLPNIWLRHLSFDIRNNVSVHIMRADRVARWAATCIARRSPAMCCRAVCAMRNMTGWPKRRLFPRKSGPHAHAGDGRGHGAAVSPGHAD